MGSLMFPFIGRRTVPTISDGVIASWRYGTLLSARHTGRNDRKPNQTASKNVVRKKEGACGQKKR
jgi:hypothetical protein